MNPYYSTGLGKLYNGDVLDVLQQIESGIVQCVVTSPPYWGLRDYGVPGQLGLEETPEEYIDKMVAIFREVRRVMRDDGTLWLNMGDSYAASSGTGGTSSFQPIGPMWKYSRKAPEGLKPKDLVGMPWRLAFALQADGWYLRSDIIWSKPNPMPESVTDRPTKAHEYVFLMSKQARYYYDADAVRESALCAGKNGHGEYNAKNDPTGMAVVDFLATKNHYYPSNRNRRTVWTIDYNGDILSVWNMKIGFCQRCGGLKVVGNGLGHVTEMDMDVLQGNIKQSPENSEHIECLMKSSSGLSQKDLQLTISAEIKDVSTQSTLNQYLSEKTSCEQTQSQQKTQQKRIVQKDMNIPPKIHISVKTENGNAVFVCDCEQKTNAKKDVWKIPTQPYSEAHFATFPIALVIPCIKAGTSEKGDCSVCGKPWVRIVETKRTFESGSGKSGNPIKGKQQPVQGAGYGDIRLGPTIRSQTIGWQPSCTCKADIIKPIVLDPFMGSGTVAEVCERYNRRWIGIELSKEYCDIAIKRIEKEARQLKLSFT